jgi:hypothetical protein
VSKAVALQVGRQQSRGKRNELCDLSYEGEAIQPSPTKSMIPSTAMASPSRFHHFASHT